MVQTHSSGCRYWNRFFFGTLTTEHTPEDPNDNNSEDENVQPFMIIPYAGKQGEKILNKIARQMPENVRPRIVYNGTKLSTFFSAKD